MPFTRAHTLADLEEALKENDLAAIGKLPRLPHARDKIQIHCKVCGNRLSRHRRPWQHTVWSIINKKVSCPKHIAKNQSLNKSEAKKLLGDVQLRLISGKKFHAKSRLVVACKKCDQEFPTCLDKVKRGLNRGCLCNGGAWRAFESLVRAVYRGKSASIGTVRPDCVFHQDRVIVDAKFGSNAFDNFKESGRRERQAKAYLETGYQVYFVCAAYRKDISPKKLYPNIHYLFIEDLRKIRILGRSFSPSQVELVLRMLQFPWEYSSAQLLEERQSLRLDYASYSVLNAGVCPATAGSQELFGCSWQAIIDAFQVPDRRSSATKVVAKRAAKELGLRRPFITWEEFKAASALMDLSEFVKRKWKGKVLSEHLSARTRMQFKCKVADHEPFKLRIDKVWDGRWCRNCKPWFKSNK